MSKYAQVIIDISHEKVDRPFTYRVPAELRETLWPGSIVRVPFGKGNTIRQGYVTALLDESGYEDDQLKEIADAVSPDDPKKQAAANQVALAAWMKQQYGSTMSAALKTVLTTGRRGTGKVRREVELTASPAEAKEALDLFEKKHQVARARLLLSLLEVPRQPYSLVTAKLHITPQTIRALEDKKLLAVRESRTLRDPVSFRDGEAAQIELNADQKRIVAEVTADAAAGKCTVSLIHGITGSGKTEVYISIIRRIVESGKAAIVLIPEISLTYQTLLRFYRYFGNRVSVVNSSMTEAEKNDQFERASSGEIDVIIGPRSALFTPFPRIGVIIIDEEHEGSYKNEQMPKYHAREVAIRIAQMHGAVVVLGSATPSLAAYDAAVQGQYRLFELTKRATGGALARVSIADMREELRAGNRSILSRKLAEKLGERLERKEQTMLFLNRRGFSGFVSCRSCGYVVKCPHCDVSLSLHRNGKLVCHYCGYEQPSVKQCPECGSPYIAGFRAGTEQVEEYLCAVYPGARILRMDADTTRRKGDYERILSAFAAEEADILVGTQMIVKGHDFPKVTLVGILLADLSLHAGDYAAAEKTFQLLTQAAGRAGRGDREGEVIFQTYQPDNYAILHAAAQDYRGFYEEEILYRRMLRYPPAAHMLAVQFISPSEEACLRRAGEIRAFLDSTYPGALVIGPAAGQPVMLRDQYRYVIYIKEEKYDKLVQYKNGIEEKNEADRQDGNNAASRAVTTQFDFDPVNVF